MSKEGALPPLFYIPLTDKSQFNSLNKSVFKEAIV